MYAFTGMFTSIVIGYMSSMVFGKHDEEKVKYNYYNLKKQSS
jgi:hypothetical protein